ncbi:hypothetical protein Rrhod_3760 [Rhodococcus rhodnii LMG 5362]|uniref:Uncharacterized protein n=1 Tax=Rhodococcus rhodnii LMG 5362 TaxID=1273125 RepID=R7WI90_9NOCA|nr:hypothetical protein Rrhod_3760 [Rhodococcus rhodnii LMG 5362]
MVGWAEAVPAQRLSWRRAVGATSIMPCAGPGEMPLALFYVPETDSGNL